MSQDVSRSVLAPMAYLAASFGIVALGTLLGSTVIAAGLGVTSPSAISVPDGFVIDLVHEVVGDAEGSWVSLTVDPKNRLLACDQDGGLFRIDVSGESCKVEKLKVDLVGAQGLLCAFGSLYANVNARGQQCGVWRLTDTNGDDQFDKKEYILPLNHGGEHGPHAMVLTPGGKRIMMVAGNNTVLPKVIERSRVPRNWSEDHLLGRMPDARGHNANRMAPGGFVMSFNPEGADRELVATGFRNTYDIAYNQDGELFAYDADMEWDVGTPWYRPTRVNHVISGAEFGWRNGTGKWPAYYPDSFGAAVDIGPGSPTGVCFGYGSSFPPKYRDALFIADWSYGNIHVVTLSPDGSSYSGSYETFATAAPLPVTDMVVHPDGNMYFTIGGRQTQSGLYRVRYTGSLDESLLRKVDDGETLKARDLRGELEVLHVDDALLPLDKGLAIKLAVSRLHDDDRAIRFAARIALEHREVASWKSLVISATNPRVRTLGLIALARCGGKDNQPEAMQSLLELEFASLDEENQIAFLRAAALIAVRLGDFTESQRQKLIAKLDKQFPTGSDILDRELAIMLVRLKATGSTAAVLAKQLASPSQESQIHYAMTLRNATEGWTDQSRRQYLGWFHEMKTARGGRSFGGFLDNIQGEMVKNLIDAQRESLADVIQPPVQAEDATPQRSRPFVKQYTVDGLLEAVTQSEHQADFGSGKQLFAEAQCYKCHRMGVQGGILGPDLTSAGGKFSIKDMLVSIVEPSKVISDQYGATQFLTVDGEIITGRVINMRGKSLTVMTNMLDPSKLVDVNRDDIEEANEARVSMMPTGLLDTLAVDEVIDLLAYLRAGGNAQKARLLRKADF